MTKNALSLALPGLWECVAELGQTRQDRRIADVGDLVVLAQLGEPVAQVGYPFRGLVGLASCQLADDLVQPVVEVVARLPVELPGLHLCLNARLHGTRAVGEADRPDGRAGRGGGRRDRCWRRERRGGRRFGALLGSYRGEQRGDRDRRDRGGGEGHGRDPEWAE